MIENALNVGSPSVVFNVNSALISFEGRCYPQKPSFFFSKLAFQIDAFLLKIDQSPLKLIIGLEYMNSISVKYIFDMIKELKNKTKIRNVDFLLEWHFEDEDIREFGESISEILTLNTIYKEVIFK